MLVEWGRNGHGPGQFVTVTGIAATPDGSVYTTDGSARVQKFTPDGEFLLEWGGSGMRDGQFQSPMGIAVAPSGRVYVTDSRACNVQAFDSQGRFLFKWGERGSGPGQLDEPHGIAVDPRGNVWVADAENHRIEEFTADGRFVRSWAHRGSRPGGSQPLGIAVDGGGRVFVTESSGSGVSVYTAEGRLLGKWGEPSGPGPPLTNWANPCPGDTTTTGGVRAIERIAALPTHHLTSRQAATLCDPGVRHPYGVATDSAGYLYVADGDCQRIQRFAPDGTWQGGWWIRGVPMAFDATQIVLAADRSGNVFASLWNGHEVRKFGYGPTPAERIVQAAAGRGQPLRALDSLLVMTLGQPSRPSAAPASRTGSVAAARSNVSDSMTTTWATERTAKALGGTLRFRWSYLGWGRQPTLESVAWIQDPSESVSGSDVGRLEHALDQLADLTVSWTGFAPHRRWSMAPPTAIHAGHGLVLRSSVARGDDGAPRMSIERVSVGLGLAELNPDTCDLRSLEGALDAPETLIEVLVPALRPRWPDLASALVAEPEPQEFLPAVQRALQEVSAPGVPDSLRDLVTLASDQWLRRLGSWTHPALPDTLDRALGRYGLQGHRTPHTGSWVYCGSMLEPLKARAGANAWADRALLIMLDEGWSTDCGGIADVFLENSRFAPVIKRGEAFLSGHEGAAVWPAVALRVAMAHETVWSLSKSEPEVWDDEEWTPPRHRARALALYRTLLPFTHDSRLARALRRHIQALEDDADNHCRVYYWEGG